MVTYGLERKETFEDDKNVNFFEVQNGLGQKIHHFF